MFLALAVYGQIRAQVRAFLGTYLFFSFSFTKMDTLQRYLDSANDVLQHVCIKVLSKGRIPRHIGFILDGNRRFARKAGAESTKFGHYEGFRQLQLVQHTTYHHADMLLMVCHRCLISVCDWAWKLLQSMHSALRTLSDRRMRWNTLCNSFVKSLPAFVTKSTVYNNRLDMNTY